MLQKDASFRLPWYEMEDATAAVQSLAEAMGLVRDKPAKLVDVLREAEWWADVDRQGCLDGLTWCDGEGYLELEEECVEVPPPPAILLVIAPFVSPGSFLEFEGGDPGQEWRWVFRNKTVETIRPLKTWPM